jgi:hypothetical protein
LGAICACKSVLTTVTRLWTKPWQRHGWSDDWLAGTLTEDEILSRLFQLNQERAKAEAKVAAKAKAKQKAKKPSAKVAKNIK